MNNAGIINFKYYINNILIQVYELLQTAKSTSVSC